MEKPILLSTLLFCLLFAGCENPNYPEASIKTELVPGQLDVRFSDQVTFGEAHDFIDKFPFRPIDLSSLNAEEKANWATIGVPEGEENYWVKMLAHYPIILFVERSTRQVPA